MASAIVCGRIGRVVATRDGPIYSPSFLLVFDGALVSELSEACVCATQRRGRVGCLASTSLR